MLRIQFLGQFMLQVDGEPARLPSRQAQSLLATTILAWLLLVIWRAPSLQQEMKQIAPITIPKKPLNYRRSQDFPSCSHLGSLFEDGQGRK
jgi:hypothetical protein